MKTTNYIMRLDPEIKAKAEETFSRFGLNLSDAITVFLHMSIEQHGFPFELTYRKPNEMLHASFNEADIIMASPNIKTYASVEEMNAAMDVEDAEESELA